MAKKKIKQINLALQGGGAHGAFTWGVLDRFLDQEDVEVAGITGASAGALNGAAFKSGMVKDGRDGARAALDGLWGRMGAVGDMRLNYWMGLVEAGKVAKAIEQSMQYSAAGLWSQFVSPYYYGPFYKNPLREVVQELDFDTICTDQGPRLFVCATKVKTGKIRVFTGDEISTDAILASACLPSVFQAVEIENPDTGETEAFWDGGYTGNPALFPLFNTDLPEDVVVVNINPLERETIPVTPQQIENRVNEISFNSSLLRELRAVAFVQRLLADGTLRPGRMSKVHVHMIADDPLMNELSVATKMMPTPLVLKHLKEAGRAAADSFLSAHKDDLGERSTVDLAEMFG